MTVTVKASPSSHVVQYGRLAAPPPSGASGALAARRGLARAAGNP
jgi:hypothetical protein